MTNWLKLLNIGKTIQDVPVVNIATIRVIG